MGNETFMKDPIISNRDDTSTDENRHNDGIRACASSESDGARLTSCDCSKAASLESLTLGPDVEAPANLSIYRNDAHA